MFFLLCFLVGSIAFQPALPSRGSSRRRIRKQTVPVEYDYLSVLSCSRLWAGRNGTADTLLYESIDALNDAVHGLCREGKLDDAMKLIHTMEESMDDMESLKPGQSTYVAVMKSYARSDRDDAAEKAEEILSHMSSLSHACCMPKGQAYSAAILAWSNSKHVNAGQRADALLSKLWSLYNSTEDQAYLPTRATYTSAITAWARSGQSKKAAERAEELLEEMEDYCRKGYESLGPTTACVNAVL